MSTVKTISAFRTSDTNYSTIIYRLSRVILDKKQKYGFDQTQMAVFLDLQLETYLDIELGEETVPLLTYLFAIDRFKTITINDINKIKSL